MKFMRYLKWILILLVILLIAGCGIYLYNKWQRSEEVVRADIYDAKIEDISPMLQLCSVEIIEDVPIKASIGKRNIFAQMTVTGNISFDVENIVMSQQGDTLVVQLPPEIIEIRESTDARSYKVIDTWTDKFLGKSNFSVAEENKIKGKVRDNYIKSLYNRGYIKRARKEAVVNLNRMLKAATGSEVLVKDTMPAGYFKTSM